MLVVAAHSAFEGDEAAQADASVEFIADELYRAMERERMLAVERAMKSVLEELHRTRLRCGQLVDSLHRTHTQSEGSLPLAGLVRCFNRTVICLELVDYYHHIWSKPYKFETDAHRAQTIAQNSERVIDAARTMFVFCMSAVEYAARESAIRHKDILPLEQGKRHYVGFIMGKSHAVGLIDRAAYESWDGLTEFRNCVVHNNGVAEQSREVVLSNGLTITMKAGEMVQGNLLSFPKAVYWVVDSFGVWCDAFLKRVAA